MKIKSLKNLMGYVTYELLKPEERDILTAV